MSVRPRPASSLLRMGDLLCAACRPLGLAVTLLLFAQWPLRVVQGGVAVLANDVAQVLFALYVCAAIPWARRTDAHVSLLDAQHPRRRSWKRGADLLLLPWCAWLLLSAWAPAWQALASLERFPDSMNPGYFLIKLAVPLMAAWLGASALMRLLARRDGPDTGEPARRAENPASGTGRPEA